MTAPAINDKTSVRARREFMLNKTPPFGIRFKVFLRRRKFMVNQPMTHPPGIFVQR
jgi:hypothetical protein